MNHLPLVSLNTLGVAISLIVIAGGLLWLALRAWSAREVDRRMIFAFMLVAVSAPILFPVTFKESATPIVRAVFEKVESLPAGSKVMISFDFDPAMAPEVHPQAEAFMRHCLAKGHKVVFMSLWATGQSLLSGSIERIVKKEFPEKIAGTDYGVLGYKAGNEGVLNVIVTDLKKMYPTDVNSQPLDSIPVFKGIESCKDFDLILTIGGGKPGAKEWILFVGDPANVPIGAGLAAVSAPQLYPYYPKQLLGLLGGIKGAAEYESELASRYERFQTTATPGLRMMGPQTLAHLVIIAFIILGNVAYFRGRRKEGTA